MTLVKERNMIYDLYPQVFLLVLGHWFSQGVLPLVTTGCDLVHWSATNCSGLLCQGGPGGNWWPCDSDQAQLK